MDKKILREVLVGLKIGEKITVNFHGNRANQSGEYLVSGKRTGRGKGGAQIIELRAPAPGLPEGKSIELGTPNSAEVINVVVEGQLYGYESAAEIPPVYETNATQAAKLKDTFASLIVGELPKNVFVDAPTVPEIHGAGTVKSGRQVRGRHGQVALTLVRADNGQEVELWSHRHSGVINKFTLLK